MNINFKCKDCKRVFDSNVGKIEINYSTTRPIFENSINCPNCGVRTIDEVLLTELGQTQMTEATMDI